MLAACGVLLDSAILIVGARWRVRSGPLAGIVLAGTLTLLAQKWLWARQRATG